MIIKRLVFYFILFGILGTIGWQLADVQACSRVLWNTNSKAVVTARTMDWAHTFNDVLFVYPRGIKMEGGVEGNAAKWTSKYGSVCASIIPYAKKYGYGLQDGVSDGINEKGLSAHLLYLEETRYEESEELPGVSYLRWCRYLLDNFATVKEAVAGMKKIKIVPVPLGKETLGLHVAVEDPTGDSAIFEYIGGNLVVHHGKQYAVMTNDPAYNIQLANLSRYKRFGGTEVLPGEVEGHERFVRLSHFVKHLPEPEDEGQAAAYILSVIRTVVVPFGAPYGGRAGEGVYPTWWTSVSDVTNGVYYFNWSENPNIVWVNLKNLDFSKDKPIMELNPREPALVGDVSKAFEPTSYK